MKKITSLLTLLTVLLLASCKGEFSSQKIGETEFTGDGIFGDLPYICAHHAALMNECKTVDTEAFEKALEKYKTFDVEAEIMKDGNKVGTAKVTFNSETFLVGSGNLDLRYRTTLPDNIGEQFEKVGRIHVVMLDKDGVIIRNYYKYNTYSFGASNWTISRKYDKNLKNLQQLDSVCRLVLTDDDGLNDLLEKSVMAKMQKLTDEQKQAGKGDLAAFDLRGNVKWADFGEYVYNFDEDGKLTTMRPKKINIYAPGDPLRGRAPEEFYQDLKRDKQGRLSSYTEEPKEEFGMSSGTKLVYDDKTGFLKEQMDSGEEQTTTTFIRNEQLFVVKEHIKGEYTEMGADEATKFERTITYKYTAVDNHGNWTKRVATDGEETNVQSRTIVYYE